MCEYLAKVSNIVENRREAVIVPAQAAPPRGKATLGAVRNATARVGGAGVHHRGPPLPGSCPHAVSPHAHRSRCGRSEEHTSELQSRFDLVCRLLLETK